MQMLALENYGVVEMNYSEMETVDGGNFWDDVVRVIGYTVAGAAILLMITGLIIILGQGNGGGGSDGGPTIGPNML